MPAAATVILTPTWIFCVFVGVVLLLSIAAGIIYLRYLHSSGQAPGDWPSFLLGPGAIQVGSFSVGILVACLGSLGGPWGEVQPTGASLLLWHADATKQPAFRTDYVDVSGYRYIGVLSRVIAPKNGRAAVVVYGIDKAGHSGAVRRFEAGTEWSMWQSRTDANRIRIGVDLPDGAAPPGASDVELALVLEQAPPQRLEDVLPKPSTSTAH